MSAAAARIGVVKAGITICVASVRAVESPGVKSSAGTARLHHSRPSELARSSGGSHARRAMVYRGKLCAVIVGRHFMLLL